MTVSDMLYTGMVNIGYDSKLHALYRYVNHFQEMTYIYCGNGKSGPISLCMLSGIVFCVARVYAAIFFFFAEVFQAWCCPVRIAVYCVLFVLLLDYI